jgi:two-component system CheB/CheR fusion protein
VRRQLEQMSRLVDDLLDVALVRSGRLTLDCARIDLRSVLANAAEAVQFKMQQRRHRFQVASSDMPIWIHGDAARLEQVFVNLFVNAAKYTEAGGDITVSLQPDHDDVVVRVRDTGIGISAEVLPHVFERYVQAGKPSRQGGLGLGLPLVRTLVHSHGGRVEALSEGPGRGSEFRVWLPGIPPADSQSSLPADRSSTPGFAARSRAS